MNENEYADLVEDALKFYELNVREVTFLVEETNLFYKVVAMGGQQYALKIFQEASSTLQDNLAESFLLQLIEENTELVIPRMISTIQGERILQVPFGDAGAVKRVALYEWIEGEDLDGQESEAYFERVGEITATMHKATRGIAIPAELSPKKWDQVFYYKGETAVYKEEQFAEFVSEEYIGVMDRAIPILNQRLQALYQMAKPQLIHGDLNPWNIRVHQGELRLLDFEEAMLALPVHDLAVHLYYYRNHGEWDYEKVKTALLKGYARILPLPDLTDEMLELLMTARRVNFLNYVLTILEDPREFIDRSLPRVKAYLSYE